MDSTSPYIEPDFSSTVKMNYALDILTIDKSMILSLALLLGIAFPLCIRNITDTYANKRTLHISNAVHSLLYITLSLITVVFRVVQPSNCSFFRFVQAILFQSYLVAYEFTLAYKSKAIIGRKRAFRTITYADCFFVITLLLRVISGIGIIVETGTHAGTCINVYDPAWMNASSFLRNVNDLFWSLFFIIPVYKVLHSSVQFKYFSSVNRMPYRHIFIANCLYPLIAFIVNLTITVGMLVDTLNGGHHIIVWQPLLFGIQNFVSTYQMNLILNVKVSDQGARNQLDSTSNGNTLSKYSQLKHSKPSPPNEYLNVPQIRYSQPDQRDSMPPNTFPQLTNSSLNRLSVPHTRHSSTKHMNHKDSFYCDYMDTIYDEESPRHHIPVRAKTRRMSKLHHGDD